LAALNDVNQVLTNRDFVESTEVALLSAKIRPRLERILLSLEGLGRESGVVPDDWSDDIDRIAGSARALSRLIDPAPTEWPPEQPAEAPIPVPESGAPRLLLVGGEATERRVLWRRLQRQGYSAVEAPDGSTALDAVAAEPFDLVLLDLMMPAMAAFELLERIKADRRLQAVPVVVIASLDESDRLVRALQMGAEDYLVKPFEPVLLRLRLNVQLELGRLRRQLVTAETRDGQERIGSVTRIAELASFLVREHCRRIVELGADGAGLEQLHEIAARLDQAVVRLRE
jgi:CheY-like chemotaxis protein